MRTHCATHYKTIRNFAKLFESFAHKKRIEQLHLILHNPYTTLLNSTKRYTLHKQKKSQQLYTPWHTICITVLNYRILYTTIPNSLKR